MSRVTDKSVPKPLTIDGRELDSQSRLALGAVNTAVETLKSMSKTVDYLHQSTFANCSVEEAQHASSVVVAALTRVTSELAITARELGRLEALAFVREIAEPAGTNHHS